MSAKIILAPVVITAVVTFLGFVSYVISYVNGWLPDWLSFVDPFAPIFTMWLLPIFGVYFALRLNKQGYGPPSAGRTVGFAATAVGAFIVVGWGWSSVAEGTTGMEAFMLAAIAGSLLAYRGWPELGRINLLYGVTSQVAVVIVQVITIAAYNEWGKLQLLGMNVEPWWLLADIWPDLLYFGSFSVMSGALSGSLAVLIFQRSAKSSTQVTI